MDAGAQLTEHEERHEFDNEVERLLTQLPPPAPFHPYRQILLADDGSSGARAALERVAAITTSETTVTVITVIPFESVGASPDPIKPSYATGNGTRSGRSPPRAARHQGVHRSPPPATQPQSSARSRKHSKPTSSSSAAATTSGGIHRSNDGRSAACSSERSPATHSSSLPEPGRSRGARPFSSSDEKEGSQCAERESYGASPCALPGREEYDQD